METVGKNHFSAKDRLVYPQPESMAEPHASADITAEQVLYGGLHARDTSIEGGAVFEDSRYC